MDIGRPKKFNETEKWCARHNNRTGAWLPLEAFGLRKRNPSGREDYCKLCKKQLNHKGIDSRRRWYLKAFYGITEEERQRMITKQDGRCAICDKKCKLNVDHNHKTGIVRKLLCQLCNRGLGLFQDDPIALRKAANYLEESS